MGVQPKFTDEELIQACQNVSARGEKLAIDRVREEAGGGDRRRILNVINMVTAHPRKYGIRLQKTDSGEALLKLLSAPAIAALRAELREEVEQDVSLRMKRFLRWGFARINTVRQVLQDSQRDRTRLEYELKQKTREANGLRDALAAQRSQNSLQHELAALSEQLNPLLTELKGTMGNLADRAERAIRENTEAGNQLSDAVATSIRATDSALEIHERQIKDIASRQDAILTEAKGTAKQAGATASVVEHLGHAIDKIEQNPSAETAKAQSSILQAMDRIRKQLERIETLTKKQGEKNARK